MRAHVYKHYGYIHGGLVPDEWPYLYLYLCLSFIFLLISARLAKVRLGTFPINPIYWHYWVVANAHVWPYLDKDNPDNGFRGYIYFWAGSVLFLIYSLFILGAIIF